MPAKQVNENAKEADRIKLTGLQMHKSGSGNRNEKVLWAMFGFFISNRDYFAES